MQGTSEEIVSSEIEQEAENLEKQEEQKEEKAAINVKIKYDVRDIITDRKKAEAEAALAAA